MDSKKISIISILTVLTVILLGLVSASNIGYTGGADPERGISIESIEFNIPDGYMKNDSKTIINQSNNTGDKGYVLNQQTYVNVIGEEIVISVVEYDDFDVDAKMLHRICEGADEKTLMGYSGYINRGEDFAQFAYAYDNKAVSITAPNEELINQMLVVDDA